ncbi:S9 family peptidase [Bradyrhizobium sp. 27S5]|uniref:S9 family peptidase n=1 Tax=Bradyrhizobium sp. 27S5 TaxID=3139728 RepID=UPI0030D2FB2F
MLVSIDRRLLLRRAALLGASLPLVKLIGPARGQSSELIARRVFFDNPDYINVRLSPDGTQLSYVAPLDGVNNLWVAPLSDLKAARPVTRVTDRNISAGYRWAHTNRHVVFFRERDGDENWRAASVDITDGKIVPLTPETGVKAFLQESDRKFPEEMLLRHNQRDKRYFDLYRANVVTGTSELVYENHDYVGLITDSAFQLRLASRLIADGSAEVFERRPDGSWAPFMTVPIADTDTTQMLDFSADGKTLYLIDSRGRDKAALFALDMATRQTTLLAADDDADIVRAIFDENRRPLAALAITDRMRWHTVDQSVARDLADLGRYGAGDISFVSNSDDLQLGTVHFERDTESGEYALLDRRTREVRKLFTQRRALDGVALRKLEPVVIPSRDGLRLNCYLTRPVEAEAGRVPLVLVIHGGPYYRDSWGFSPVHQWLASRGYAVLAVNYRGSTGFGKAFSPPPTTNGAARCMTI